MNFKRIFISIMAVAMLFSIFAALPSNCAASHWVDRRFVASSDHTGYYVDVNTIEYDGVHTLTADIYLVKARNNFMFMYHASFNTAEKSYQLLSSKIYQYDTRQLLRTSDTPMRPLGYGDTSIGNNAAIKALVEYSLEWKRTHINKTTLGEILE